MYFIVNFNVFFKLIKVHSLVSELFVYQNAQCNDKNFLFKLNTNTPLLMTTDFKILTDKKKHVCPVACSTGDYKTAKPFPMPKAIT